MTIDNARQPMTVRRRNLLLGALAGGALTTLPGWQALAGSDEPGDVSDEDFFGVWDAAAGQWSAVPWLDYGHPGLEDVENAAKAGNHELASQALLAHTRARPSVNGLTPSTTGQPIDLMLDGIYTLGTDLYLQNRTFGTTRTAATVTVTSVVERSLPGNEITFMLTPRTKGPGVVSIDNVSGEAPPLLRITTSLGTQDIIASSGTAIHAADPSTNHSADAVIEVHDEGAGPFAPNARRGYIRFDLSSVSETPTDAKLVLTGQTVGDTSTELMLFWSKTPIDPASAIWDNTLQGTWSWQGDPGKYDWRQPEGAAVDIEFGWVLPRFLFTQPIVNHYLATEDEDVAAGMLDLIRDFIADANTYTSSGHATYDPQYGAGAFPRSLDTAFRTIALAYAFYALRDTATFDAATNLTILKTQARTGRFLLASEHPADNWMTTINNSLLQVAVAHPELHGSDDWRAAGMAFLASQLSDVVFPDGGYSEASWNYSLIVARKHLTTVEFLTANGITGEAPAELEGFAAFLTTQMLPNGLDPSYGDGANGQDVRDDLSRLARAVERDDLLHIATQGAEGVAPDFDSVMYPDTKVAVQRSGWGAQDLYLRFNVDQGNHHHPDQLAIQIFAHGANLLPTMGTKDYSTDPVSVWLRTATEANSTVAIDGLSQARISEGAINQWATTPQFDFVEGWTDATPGVRHRRSVLFLRPRFWIVSDDLEPTDDADHEYRQAWHFLPTARIEQGSDQATRTNFVSGANLELLPCGPDPVTESIEDGYCAAYLPTTAAAKYAVYSAAGGRTRFETVIHPRAEGNGDELSVARLVAADPHSHGVAVTITGAQPESGIWLRAWEDGTHVIDGNTLVGRAAYIRTVGDEHVVLLVDATSVTTADDNVSVSLSARGSAQVRLDRRRRTVEIQTLSEVESVSVKADWAVRVTVNGNPVRHRLDGEQLTIRV